MTLPRIARVDCDGFNLSVFATDDFLSQQVLRNGTWGRLQHALTDLFLRGTQRPVVIDVGANLGLYTVPVAAMAAKLGGRVIAFEPQRIVFQQLCANVFANRLDNVWAHNQAVGAECGTIDLPGFDYAKVANIGAFSLDPQLQKMRGFEGGLDRSQAESVSLVTLDSLDVDEQVRVVKIDVEGMEIEVVRGARDFLARNRHPPLLFEAWEADWFTAQREALFAEVRSAGYAITRLSTDEFIGQHPECEARVRVAVEGKQISIARER